MEKKSTKGAKTRKSKTDNVTQETTKIEKGERFLPIGTIVLLKGGRKRVMITGFCVTQKDRPNEIWDYCGCLYPEGVIAPSSSLLFDHSQIIEVFHLGLIDEEEQKFKEKLNQEVQKNGI